MTLSAPERIREDSTSAAIISSVHVDMIRIAPKKSYSMGGHDYTGMNYHGILVRVRTEDGVEGLGEVFVTPGWYGADTPLSYIYLLNKQFGPAAVGQSVFDIAKLVAKMDQLWMGNYWSKAALEFALYDAAAKTIGRPLIDLLGGKVRDRFPLVGGIGEDSPEGMAESAREYVNRGFGTVKLKIGAVDDPDLDVARVRVVREEVGPDVVVRVDANGVYGSDVRGAVKLIKRLEAYDIEHIEHIEHIEQPLAGDQISGMASIRDAIELGNGIQTSVASLHELALACSNPAICPAGEFPGPDAGFGHPCKPSADRGRGWDIARWSRDRV